MSISALEKSFSQTLTSLQESENLRNFLIRDVENALGRFPHYLDERIYFGLEYLIIHASHDFLKTHSLHHLKTVLLIQFSLQKKIEKALADNLSSQKPLFLKLFRSPSSICITTIYHSAYGFQRERLLKAFLSLVPGIRETPFSSYEWHHNELPYCFSYVEVAKLRGSDLSRAGLKEVEETLKLQLQITPPLTPCLFWPYNEEESHREIRLLEQEIQSTYDLPHIAVHFQQQTPSSLEFLIHLVRPQSEKPIDSALKCLPDSLHYFCHFQKVKTSPFPVEIAAFSLRVSPFAFEVRDSINLLYTRRFVLKHLETILGPFRDCNAY